MYIRFKWRLVAFVTVVLYVLLVFLVVRLLVHNFVWAVAFGLTGALLLYAAWRAVASRGRLLLLASLLAFVLECVLFLRNQENIRRLIAIAVVAFVYVGLVNILSRMYWRTRRHAVMAQHKVSHFRKPVLIINPKAGDGRALKAHIHELALAMDIKVFTTSLRDDVEVLARRAVFEGADVLGVSGGDGSIGAAAKVALENNLPLIVLPGGTRCHFARDLGLDPKRIVDALASYHGVERHIDVADINQRIFLNNASFGLYADIVDHPAYRKHKFRVSWETMHALASGTKDLYDLRFRGGGHRFHRAAQVLVGVNRYNLIDIFEFGHRERLDEGVLQIVAITQLTDSIITDLLRTIDVHKLRHHTDGGEIHQWTSKSFTITNDSGNMVVGVDGEREVYVTPVTVRIKPRALRVYVPAEGVRARPEHPFSTLRARRIWRAAIHPTN